MIGIYKNISKQALLISLTALALLCAGCNRRDMPPSTDAYSAWLAEKDNQHAVNKLEAYLQKKAVLGIIPFSELLRSDVRWKKCKAQPFIIPPERYWPHMVSTLRLIHHEVIPSIGPIEALSVFRDPAINSCIGGASKSYHLRFYAIDMRPKEISDRRLLIQKLCRLHRQKGQRLKMGLGIYSGTRFHIDSAGYRSWGKDQKVASSPCRTERS